MSTYVLVHGAAHGGWCYQRVARILRSAGHDVYTPTLTGLGERSHLLRSDIDLDFHINDILAVLRYEDLRDVILVGHSYGGMVVTGVADRAPDLIGHLVYLDAITPMNGESLFDAAPGPATRYKVREGSRVVDGVELILWPGAMPLQRYGVTDPDDVAWLAERLTPHPYRTVEQKLLLTNEDALWAIPETHIVCTATLPFRDTARLARAKAAGRIWDIDTGHDMMITEPRKVAELLLLISPAAAG